VLHHTAIESQTPSAADALRGSAGPPVSIHLDVAALDGYRTSVHLEDALAANVIVADRLQGGPISREHGAPFGTSRPIAMPSGV
jgi:DMSO/TMAO reductase YedYZ molybdopterin-dependent catalytic subunit